MPFIIGERREMIKNNLLKDFQPGDYCYVYYKSMVEEWKANPRWTTAHNIYKKMKRYPQFEYNEDKRRAHELAWQVFFQLYVMPYEEEKREQNGDIS